MGEQLRADARRNREQIIEAAREVFMALGHSAPLDQIAERAGVGNATLYRRFPSRDALVRRVAIDNMELACSHATAALAEEPDAWAALERFVRTIVEREIVALLPILGPHVEPGSDFDEALRAVRTTLGQLLDAARAEGTLRPDVEAGDLVLILATVTRPLPELPAELTAAVRRRHVALLLDGLRAPGTPLPGAALTVESVGDQLGVAYRAAVTPPAAP
ncbi:TetR/AcrR family transcriptional regulator [Pseudonocardia sp. TRM90224]|uniref:TetR/AcrR family transcriptional regulator n=1 Tax=Pseudonocardia sp. TRM90224 TaxID=2812678 RepID=UPI001E35F918|nr:TetR/AcrR family transcriptional regulator [Pseudonocardia sp. TRM90224]